ncbi:MAG: type I restriction enzyme HsdR N-terminal domain-containing protein [Bacteroides sp.]|nr:type I restriction enzyme HsdR N-terminal domain-containing protein [Bacteroides sp.]
MSTGTAPNNAITPLNLPPGNVRLRQTPRGDEIYDPLRQKWLLLTPEEWVRQHFSAYLHSHLSYPQSLMANEIAIRLNGTSKRCDTVIFDRKGEPIMIVEYKSPSITITQDVFNQIARYSLALRVEYLTVSNGLHHYCCRLNHESHSYSFLKEIPLYDEL